MDRFSWIVIGVVGLLLLAAVGVATLRPGQGAAAQEVYLEQDTPEGVVHDAYVAYLSQDSVKMESYYSKRVQAIFKKDNQRPTSNYYPDQQSRRMRVESVKNLAADQATVIFAIDTYSPGGLFDQGNVWTNRQTLMLIREDGGWKIDSENFYFN